MLFPLVFLLAALLNGINGVFELKTCGRDKKRFRMGAFQMVLCAGLGLLGVLSALSLWFQTIFSDFKEQDQKENESGDFKDIKKEKDYVSGQELCESLGVSRTAVWKAIRQLEEQGYVIEAVRNKGYRLVEEADVLTVAELHSVLDTKWLGKELEYYYETDSTNNRARDAAEKGASHGFLAVADCQTAGKGRRGRVWNSPHGTDIYMSFVLRPTFTPSQASMLTLVAGMAVVKGYRKPRA